MSNNLHRYGIMVHVKGRSYEDDYWFTDNKHFRIREFSHDAAEVVLRILQHQWGDGYSGSGGWIKMIDYEDMILSRQELIEIWEDEPDSAECPIGRCWWDDIPEDDFYVSLS